MTESQTEKKKHGCFFYGCIVSLGLIILIVLAIFLGIRLALKRVNATVAQYSDSQAMPLPRSEMSAEERENLRKRVAAFNAAVMAGSNTAPLTLTGPEINALLADSPEMSDLKDRFYITIVSNQAKGQLSLPLENLFRIPYVDTKGRFLNGAGIFNVHKTNEDLFVGLDSVEVKGRPLPEKYMSQLRQMNFADNMIQNPTNHAFIKEFERIEITNGMVVIYPKRH
jgi:hypothetical protein